jgi:hypothetical protein
MKELLIVTLLLQVLLVFQRAVRASNKPCNSTVECVTIEGIGSECREGTCSNPVEQGCLFSRLPGWKRKRVCNSDDTPEAAQEGICDPPQFDYMEIRIISGNWESAFFEGKYLQHFFTKLRLFSLIGLTFSSFQLGFYKSF